MIIDRFLDNCGIVARNGVATCLLCGLVTDTGRFQYQNADAAAFHAASRWSRTVPIRRASRSRSTRACA